MGGGRGLAVKVTLSQSGLSKLRGPLLPLQLGVNYGPLWCLPLSAPSPGHQLLPGPEQEIHGEGGELQAGKLLCGHWRLGRAGTWGELNATEPTLQGFRVLQGNGPRQSGDKL